MTVNNPVPTLTGLSPASIQKGTGAFSLVVTGTNFVDGSTVKLDGSARATVFTSSTSLTATMLSADSATLGNYSITVTNATPGGGTSNTSSFVVTTPPPISIVQTEILQLEIIGIGRNALVGGATTNIGSNKDRVDFGQIWWGKIFTGALTFRGTTNRPQGFTVYVSQNHDLESSQGFAIKGFDANRGTVVKNSAPVPWVTPLSKGFFGYSTTNATLSGQADRFSTNGQRNWAGVSINPQEIARRVGDPNRNLVSYEDVLLLQLELTKEQERGSYSNEITIIIAPNL